jgi:hypothetical protein
MVLRIMRLDKTEEMIESIDLLTGLVAQLPA